MRRLPRPACLLLPLLCSSALVVHAGDGGKAGASPAELERRAFLAYKLRETGQAPAPAAAAEQGAQAQLLKEIDKQNRERKPYRSIAYGSTFGSGAPALR